MLSQRKSPANFTMGGSWTEDFKSHRNTLKCRKYKFSSLFVFCIMDFLWISNPFRWFPAQQRFRWDVQEAVRGSEPHQLPVRAGLWQLCGSWEGQDSAPLNSWPILTSVGAAFYTNECSPQSLQMRFFLKKSVLKFSKTSNLNLLSWTHYIFWYKLFSVFCRKTLILAFPSPWLRPSSWWSTTCGVRRRKATRRETATVKFSSSNRRFACGGNRYGETDCRPAQLPITVRQHYKLLNEKVVTCMDTWCCGLFFMWFFIQKIISWLFVNMWMCFQLLDVGWKL